MIINNFNLTIFERFVKLIDKFDFLQRNIKNQFAKFFYLRKNIIQTIWNHSTLMIKFVNSSKNVIDLINNLHFLIINYEIVHKSFTHENYIQFYNDKMKKKTKLKTKYFLSIVIIKTINQIFAIKIVHIWNCATYFFENYLNHRFNVKKNILCAKKSIVNRLITFNRSEIIQSKNLKIKNFIFELNLILTEKFINESSNIKTKTLTQ